MGHDVLTLLDLPLPLFNIQKGRVDYILDVANNRDLRARVDKVAPFMERQDVIPLIAQEGDLTWLKFHPPVAVFMDSFSELTDQLFVNRHEKWRFCSYWSDVRHNPQFDHHFETRGLLPVTELLSYYQRFFGLVRQAWGGIPIFFLHFPVKLDKRVKFQLRYQHILMRINQISAEFQPFYSLIVDDSVVDWPAIKTENLEDFPYHYNQRTYEVLANQVRATAVFETLKAARR